MCRQHAQISHRRLIVEDRYYLRRLGIMKAAKDVGGSRSIGKQVIGRGRSLDAYSTVYGFNKDDPNPDPRCISFPE